MQSVDSQQPIGNDMKGRVRLLALVPLTLILCWLAAMAATRIVASFAFSQPPPSVNNPLVLPDARDVSRVNFDEANISVVSYETAADPEAVYDFYEEALVKDGWGGDGYFSKPKRSSEGMIFEWDQTGLNGCEALGYTLVLLAKEADPTTTQVQITITKINPC